VASEAAVERRGGFPRWRLWALVPVVLLVGTVSLFAVAGGSLVDLVGQNPPPADEFDIRRVEFKPNEIRIRVTNPQPDDLTIASVTVDDAIVPFTIEGSTTLGRLRSSTIVVPFDWVQDDPIAVGVTSSTGIETVQEIPAAVETPGPSAGGFLGYGIIGFLVGIVPVALGLLWLPSLRRARPEWLAAFMALTGGLLSFLAVEALSESFALQATLPSALGGAGLVLLGVALSYLTLTFISHRFTAAGEADGGVLGGVALATLVAVGIGLHNFGEGLGIAAPIAEGKRAASLARLAALVAIAGAPAILGTWLGGYIRSDVLGVVFFAAAAGAALEVIVEVGRFVARRAPGGLTSGYAIGGFLAGISVMYVTGLLA